MQCVVESVAHLGCFLLVDETSGGGQGAVLLVGPDGRAFRPADVLPVLSVAGKPVQLTGADVVLVWLVSPRRTLEESRLGTRYLAQWPKGPQVGPR